MPLPTLPTPPSRSMSQDTFDSAIEAWINALQAWTADVNAMGISTILGTIQNTPIGNVTPSTGAFTTLSATGTVTTTKGAGSPTGGSLCYDATGTTTGYLYSKHTNANGELLIGVDSAAGGSLITGSTGYDAAIVGKTGIAFSANNGPAMHMRLSATGLAVTGTISATTSITGATLVSTVATGTAPFTVSSTTEVANLKAATATNLSGGVTNLAAGTVGAPSLYFSTDTTSGLYRIGANNIGVAISGVKVVDINNVGISVSDYISAPNIDASLQLNCQMSVYCGNLTAIPAGGSNSFGFLGTSASLFGVFFGSGVPTLSAAKGSLYLRSDGTTTNNRMYVNTDGTTTWTAVTTVA